MEQNEVERAIEACYDAILIPENWSAALDGVCRSFNAAAMLFYPVNPDLNDKNPIDPNRPLLQMPASGEYTGLLDEYVQGEWYLNHYRAERGRPLMQAGQSIIFEHDLATDDERKKLRHYNELYLRWGFPGFVMAAFRVEGRPWAVPMLRASGQGHFQREDADRLAALVPHLARIIRLSEKVAQSHALAELDMLERLGSAAMLLDWRGQVVQVNARAYACLGADLKIRRGALVASDAQSNRDLQRLLNALRALSSSQAAPPLEKVIVRRAEGNSFVIEALPVTRQTASLFQYAQALLIVTAPEHRKKLPEELLRKVFGLTGAEARLAAHLAEGDSLEDTANALHITKNTARVQLKAVFAKTGTNRQTSLALLLRGLVR